jgi:Protein of unknown function (DUF2809)
MPKRLLYVGVTIVWMLIGLASRRYTQSGDFIHDYLGDAIWAGMIYFGFKMFFPTLSAQKTGLLSLLFTYSIEISQLCQAAWLNSLRHTLLGGLVLGFGFLWSDLVMYFLGIMAAMLGDRFYLGRFMAILLFCEGGW